jgi:zinc D-Ala-D-Ala dipeptidase
LSAGVRFSEIATHGDFCSLRTLPVAVDLRYASTNNFTGRNLYGEADCAWLHREAARALAVSATWLASNAPNARILVLDALRPHSIHTQLWQAIAGTPLAEYVADPAVGSIHSYGMAVDVTLIDAAGRELDMGSAFDDMSELSHPALEAQNLAGGRLDHAHVANRECLRGAMHAGGFSGISTEWWHFNCGERARVRREFARVE